jgi:threonine/homoserine/homoserine lactone efflux protein
MSILFPVACLFALNVLTPGASFVLTVSNALSHGRSAGYGVALGLSSADILLALVAVAGLAAVLKANENAILLLGYIGGAWIAATGLKMIHKTRQEDLEQECRAPGLTTWKGMRLGIAAGLSNPQSIICFASVFVAAMVGEPSVEQSLAIVSTVAVSSLCARCGIVRLVTLSAIRKAYVAQRRKIEKASGAALVFFGLKLSVAPLIPWSAMVLDMLAN